MKLPYTEMYSGARKEKIINLLKQTNLSDFVDTFVKNLRNYYKIDDRDLFYDLVTV